MGRDGGRARGIEILRVAAGLGSVKAAAAAGEALHWMGDYERAIGYLERAVAGDAEPSPWLSGLLGEALWMDGRGGRAESYLRLALDSHVEFGLPLAKLLLSRGEMQESRDLLNRVVEEGVYGAVIVLGNLYEEAGDDQRAMIAYRHGIDQGDAHCAFNLALLHRALGNGEAAREAFETARGMGDLTEPPFPFGESPQG